MHTLERAAIAIRHSDLLSKQDWFWDRVRPLYDAMLDRAAGRGLSRTINGTDFLRVSPRCRNVPEYYEPKVWSHLMSRLRPDDTVVDVGAFIGLYAVAIAKRLRPPGKVVAFEPDSRNHRTLAEHVRLNGVQDRIRVIPSACGSKKERVAFVHQGSQSHAASAAEGGSSPQHVECDMLDHFFPRDPVGILKVDVEGYEERVLQGGEALLSDPARRPRAIYVEVHPYAWSAIGTTSDSLLGLLRRHGYQVHGLEGAPVSTINRYGEVIATS